MPDFSQQADNMGATCSRMPCCASNSSVAREVTDTEKKEGGETVDQPRELEPQSSQPRTLHDFGSDFRRQVCVGLWQYFAFVL